MSYLGNIEEEFSQMAITNRSALNDSHIHGTPAGKGSRAGDLVSVPSNLDDTSFLGSQLGGGDDPRQAYTKVRERLMELEIEKEE